MKHLQELNDFEVLGYKTDDNNSAALYEKYLHFKKAIKSIPLKVLQQQGWLESRNDISSLSKLFTNSLDHKNQLFRKNLNANDQLISLWSAKLTSEVKDLFVCQAVPKFNGITKIELQEIAKLSQDENEILKLPNILLSKGIILIYQQSLPSMKLDGTVYRLGSGNPVIGMSFRYPRLDNFWFTLMHELAHIYLHFEQLDTPILDDLDNEAKQDIEIQANRLAKDSFVSRYLWRNCPPRFSSNNKDVITFAKEINIHPAIVAGMMQREKNNYKLYRGITDNLNVRDMVFRT